MAAVPGAMPPGPEAPQLAQTIAFHRDPLGVLARCRARYGKVFTLRLKLAGEWVVMADPRFVASVGTADPGAAHAGEARREILPQASPRSVFGADDATYRGAHARIATAFGADAIARRGPEMRRIAAAHADSWPRRRPFRLLPRVRALVDEIFVRLMLGIDDPGRVQLAVAAIRRLIWTPVNPPVSPPGEGDGALGVVGKLLFNRRRAPLARLLIEEIEARRALPGAPDGDDLLALSLAARPELAPEAIVDELLAVLMAGQEPPALALTALLDRLGRSPELARRFATADEDDPLRDAVVSETLRLRPPAAGVLRRLTEPMTFGAYALPAGTLVMVPIALVHRDPQSFAEPEAFRPERWLHGEADERALFPFGVGARRCIGEALARAEIANIIPAVVSRLHLRPLSRRPERPIVRGTVLAPVRGALTIATPVAAGAAI
ncbi:MAG TPA: cytochrome P450 [Solirubrobacterales bacterium]|nr:cytochrome P450 [Solirubrobacterales bacterium]